MIDLQFKIHDKFSVEFKIGYFVDSDSEKNKFAVNMWLFVPNSLDITHQSYSKGQFYRDIKSNVRLITPIFLLSEIASGNAIPLRNLETAFRNLAVSPVRQNAAEYEYQIKMFMAIFKSSLRDEVVHILDSPIADDTDVMCRKLVSDLRSTMDAYRELRRIINVATVPDEKINYFLFGDEFMTLTAQKHLFRLAESIEIRYGNQKFKETGQAIRELIAEEIEHEKIMGYPTVATDSSDNNREIVFRQGVLKKYIESDLFLKARKKKDAVVVEQVYLSLAAGISMIFATAIAFSFQQRYGNFTMPLFVALVVSYMLKDRIKDTMRYFFAHRLGSKYFDNKTTVSIKEERIGTVREGVDFITDEKTPREVMELRSRSPLLQAENRISDEKIILYRKMVDLDAEALRKENKYTIAGINEIVRLHFNSFIKKMDNPLVPLHTLDQNGAVVTVEGEKVYYLNILMQLHHDTQIDYKRLRLVFNRHGIIEIEEFR